MATSTRRSARLACRLTAAAPADSGHQADVGAQQQPRKRQRKMSIATTRVAHTTKAAKAAVKQQAGGGPSRDLECELWQAGVQRVAGVDEAGRGPLAGPVVAAACIIPEHVRIEGIDDSKKITEEKREAIYGQLVAHPEVEWAVQVIEAKEIDEINILQAAMKAMEGAVAGLAPAPGYVLVDGNRLPKALDPATSRPVVKGDAKCYAIAAASIIAKVTRDRLMLDLDRAHPQYGFAKHKGYGVPAHLAAIRQHGPCPAHRRSFAPIKGNYD